jgi:hypothetical protein
MPDDVGFYVEDVTIPVSWFPVTTANNRLYVEVSGLLPGNRLAASETWIAIPSGSYTAENLAKQIATTLTTVEPGLTFAATYNSNDKTFTITATSPSTTFKLYTDNEVRQKASALNREAFLASSMNSFIKNFTASGFAGSWKSGYVDMVPLRNLFIHSSGIGNFSSMDLNGARTIIKKVPVTAAYGEVIVDQFATGLDYYDCSHQTLSRLGFRLCDHAGNVVDLNGLHWSFSLVFSRIQNGT